jgi:hypothetical protein
MFALGCRFGRTRGAQPYRSTPQPHQKFRELRTVGTATSLNTDGSCTKKVNGQMISAPQIGFTYTVGDTTYNGVGCAYDSSLQIGSKVNFCYQSTRPGVSDVCEK